MNMGKCCRVEDGSNSIRRESFGVTESLQVSLGLPGRKFTDGRRDVRGDRSRGLARACAQSRRVLSGQDQNATRARIRRVAMLQASVNSSSSCIRLELIMHTNELVVEDTSLHLSKPPGNDDNVMQGGP